MEDLIIEKYSSFAQSLTVNEHYDLFHNIILVIEPDIDNIPALSPRVAAFRAAFAHEDDVYKKHKQFITKELDGIDKIRKNIASDVYETIKIKRRSRDNSVVLSGDIVYTEILETYKGVNRVNIRKRTTYITNMLNDFDKPEYQSHIVKLELMGLINELTSIQAVYESKANSSGFIKRRGKEGGSATDARPKTNAAFKKLVKGLISLYDANLITTQDADLHDNLNKVAFAINSIIDAAKLAKSRLKPKKKKGDNSDDSGDNTNYGNDDATDIENNDNSTKDNATDSDTNDKKKNDPPSGTEEVGKKKKNNTNNVDEDENSENV
jgi:hypothetical protein